MEAEEKYLGISQPVDIRKTISLLSEDQVEEFSPTARTKANWKFFDLVFELGEKSKFIRDGDDGWRTCPEFRRNNVIRHLNGRESVGVFGDKGTRFLVLDIDNHDKHHGQFLRRSNEIFLRKVRILMDEFHGRFKCHYQFRERRTSGIHFIFAFNHVVSLKPAIDDFRKHLLRLDEAHPDLYTEIRTLQSEGCSTIKTLGETEIYPNKENAVCLPLAPGRLVATDRILSTVKHLKKDVADVESYVNWLGDLNRQYISKEIVLSYLERHLPEVTEQDLEVAYLKMQDGGPVEPASQAKKHGKSPASKPTWKGHLFEYIHGFWIDGNSNDISLNEHIRVLVLCFLSYRGGYSNLEIESRMMEFVQDLPPAARSASQRLANRQWKSIRGVIRRCIKTGFGGQPKDKASSWKFSEIAHTFPSFDPGDKLTWQRVRAVSEKSNLQIDWNHVAGLIVHWTSVLKVKDPAIVTEFLSAIVNLAVDKEMQGNGFGRQFLQKWIRDKFPQIKVGDDSKVKKILTELRVRGIVERTEKGFRGRGASRWTLGWMTKQLLAGNTTYKMDLYLRGLLSPAPYETCTVELSETGKMLITPGGSLTLSG